MARRAILSAVLSMAVLCVLAPMLASAQTIPATKPAPPPISAELQRVRAALEKYQDAAMAIHDGYFSSLLCINFPHDSLPGHEPYPKGAMGIHFLNAQLLGTPLDPLKPQVLLYEPEPGGKLRLNGAEWLVPLAVAKGRPRLFEQEFFGPMEGHEPLQRSEAAHYDLHVWLFKDNPEGMFAPTNPAVNCTGYSYALDVDSTKMVMSGMKHTGKSAHKHSQATAVVKPANAAHK
jgi:hypothetical protein